MTSRSPSFGSRRERQVRDVLASEDWIVFRPAGSFGCADLVALRDGSMPRLIQVKATAAGPYSGFLPAERLGLIAVAKLAGAVPLLAWWPPRGKLRWLGAHEWPKVKVSEEAA